MGDLFDEVMGCLGDAGPVVFSSSSRHAAAGPDGFHENPGMRFRNEPQSQSRAYWPRLQMDEFDRQVLNDPDPRDDDRWMSRAANDPGETHFAASTVTTGGYNYQGGRNSQHIAAPPAPSRRAVGKLDLSQFEYNPSTPKRDRRQDSSSPLRSSPIPFNLNRPYKPVVKKRRADTSSTPGAVNGNATHDDQGWRDTNVQGPPLRTAPVPGKIALSHAPPVVQGIPLVAVDTLPDRFRGMFPFALFNAVQSRCFEKVYGANDNLVLSAPTGSGKTAVLELAVCRLAREAGQGTYKVIYQAPTKALCAERKRDWESKFAALGLVCTELTGDTQQAQLKNVKGGDVIITTPEKWDSMTRRWEDHRRLLEMVRLFLIDEVHILKETRGATLEVVVSRMKSTGSDVRFVALSATVPNSADIAAWLGKNSQTPDLPASEERFGEEFRPVKLQKFVYGYQPTGNDFMFDKTLDKMLPEIIQKHSARKPMMIFCMTRAMCVSTAKMLADKWRTLQERERYWPAPNKGFSFKDKDLQFIGNCGVAFHHAGLDFADRALVERLFLEGVLHVICCTSTLAVGVNLPTYLVIIKNTVTWADGQTKEYVDLEVMQMLGRAGRPQFEEMAVAVIMTKRENKGRYEKMVSGTEVLESCLHENLLEHMNAEIGLGTIKDVESAKSWLKSTFLYVRLKLNPTHYKLDQHGSKGVDRNLEEICEKNINLLDESGLVVNNNSRLACSELGDAMARYYIKFGTMQTILGMEEKAGVGNVLLALSKAEEFKDIRFRGGERGLYKEINKDVKYPIKVDLSNASHKACILIQFEIGMLDFPPSANLQKYKTTLMQDKNLVFQHCHRVIRCIIDCKLHFRDSISTKSSLEMARSLKAKVWENSPLQLRQIEGFGPASVKKFINAGISTFEQLERLEAHKIETLMSRNPPYGSKIKALVEAIPKLRVMSHQVPKTGNRKGSVKVSVRTEIGYLNEKVPGKFRGMSLFANFLAERSDGVLIEFRRIPGLGRISKLEGGKSVQFTVDLEHAEQTVLCHLVCEDLVGTLKTHVLKPDVDLALFATQPLEEQRGTSGVKMAQPFTKARGVRDQNSTEVSKKMGNPGLLPSNVELIKDVVCGNPGGGEDLFFLHIDDFDLSDFDDEELDQQTTKNTDANTKSLARTNSIAVGELEVLEGGKQLPNGNWECRHKCGDKNKCKHFCCREGVAKQAKPMKGKGSKDQESALTQTKYPMSMFEVNKQSFEARQGKTVGSSLLRAKLKQRASALATCIRNTDIEVLDLAAEDSRPSRESGKKSSLAKLETLHAKSTMTNFRTLVKKPIYSYSSKEQPDISFLGIGKSCSSNEEFRTGPPQEALVEDSLPDHASSDYEMGSDLFAEHISIAEDAGSAVCAGLVVEEDELDLVPLEPASGSPGYVSQKGPSAGLHTDTGRESPVDGWKSPKFEPFENSCQHSGSAMMNSEDEEVGTRGVWQKDLYSSGSSVAPGSLGKKTKFDDRPIDRAPLLGRITRSGPGPGVKVGAPGSELPQKRKNPFTFDPINERELNNVEPSNIVGPEIQAASKILAVTNVVTQPEPPARNPRAVIPMDVLDFLGGCVIYSEENTAEDTVGL